jgi:sigma-B regulation protein RsbU (phosphoserine phosphatase)
MLALSRESKIPAQAPTSLANRKRRFRTFWQRITEGITLQALWSQFVAEARAGYEFYTRDVDWEVLRGKSRLRRFIRICRALFWAMMMKLSPVRRVVLLIALVCGLLALTSAQVEIGPARTVVEFPDNRLMVLVSLGGLVILLALELSDRVTMKRDLEIAREIQQWLLPDAPPQVAGLDIAFISRPANTVGGDFYDAFLRDGGGPGEAGRLLVVVADVAGKSVPAALLMATFQASFRALAAQPTTLPDLVAGMNRYSYEHSLHGLRFTTAFFAEINSEERTLAYVRAGHNPPVLRRADGDLERLDAGTLPLGISLAQDFTPASVRFNTGDLLIIFSDGLVEAENSTLDEYGEDRLIAAVKAAPARTAGETLKLLLSSVDAFVGTARQHDDVTLVVVRAT